MTAPDVRTPPARGANAEDAGTQNSAIVADLDDGRKELLTLQARAAINGASLYELANGKYLLCKYGLSRELDSLHAAAKLMQQMGCR
jgi:hypothetical protein